ncbi:hypothetical protein FHS83_000595 [Rhizomicrobium palustre]|uniref:Flavinylation-associated cytochrome domain-containing protein n=1 Tax=Rhizomicrobium palustre TaxID=189966 RepID=A0A846MWB2_9PROT|nr:DUF4405 domain-containing protein [Rhizomicrobium palustre]NIK87277.1 hypothetical protein [Rhizomicrobium palustre]
MQEFLRRYATPLSLVTGLSLAITGIMMFFGIRGEIGEVHEWLGWAFVAALLMHIVRNWRGVLGMMRSWSSKAIVGVLGAAMAVLIIAQLPNGEARGHAGGPWLVARRVADVPIATSAPALGMSADQVIEKLKTRGLTVETSQQSLSEVAEKNDVRLPHLFGALLNDA